MTFLQVNLLDPDVPIEQVNYLAGHRGPERQQDGGPRVMVGRGKGKAPVASKRRGRASGGVCGLSAAAWQGGACACGIGGFAGSDGGWRSVRLRQLRLTFRNLLFAVFVEGIHDIVQMLVYDLAVASHHRH